MFREYSLAETVAGVIGDLTVIDVVYEAYPDLNEGMQTIFENSFEIISSISISEFGFGRDKEYTLESYHVEPTCDYPEIFAELFERAEEAARRKVDRLIDAFNGI